MQSKTISNELFETVYVLQAGFFRACSDSSVGSRDDTLFNMSESLRRQVPVAALPQSVLVEPSPKIIGGRLFELKYQLAESFDAAFDWRDRRVLIDFLRRPLSRQLNAGLSEVLKTDILLRGRSRG